MTTKAINKALDNGRVVIIDGDPLSRICRDLFGQLTVVALNDEPVRLATLSDKRKAVIQ